jgi:hypothetical protein
VTSAQLIPLLIDEATKKSGLVWVVTSAASSPVWLLWHDGSAYVLSGPGEQPCEGLADSGRATVTVRSKDKGSRLVSWVAEVTRVPPDSEAWAEIVPLLQAKRLNLVDAEAAVRRWAAECVVHRLTPTGELVETPDGSLAAPPAPTPATTDVPMPFTVGSSTRKLPRRQR